MFDPLHKWLGIPPDQQPPNHYRLLGLAVFEHDGDVINAAADKQLSFLHQMTGGEHVAMAEDLANQISAARLCLTSDEKRRVYDDRLRSRLEVVSTSAAPASIAEAPIAAARSPATQQIPASAVIPATPGPELRVRRTRTRTRTGRSGANRKRGSGLSYWHYSILLCIVVLLGIAVALKRGLLTFDAGDSKANQVAGVYLCLSEGDWNVGLPCLAKGPESVITSAAKQELASKGNADNADAAIDIIDESKPRYHGELLQRVCRLA